MPFQSRPTAPVAGFFGLVLILSLPFWVAGAYTGIAFLPDLPFAALSVVCPTAAAAILCWRRGGARALAALLRRAGDVQRAGARLVAAALISPALFGLAFWAARWLDAAIPDPQVQAARTLSLFALFMVGALLEELGWTGYALDPLQARYGPRGAGIRLGLFWVAWHFVPLAEAGRGVEWIAWWSVWTLAERVIMVWLYNWTRGSVLAVALYHAMSNLCWQLYPVHGSHFDPRISAVLTAALAVALSIRRGAGSAAPREVGQESTGRG